MTTWMTYKMEYINKTVLIFPLLLIGLWSCKTNTLTTNNVHEDNEILDILPSEPPVTIESLTSLECLEMISKGREVPFESYSLFDLYWEPSRIFTLPLIDLLPCAIEEQSGERDIIVDLMNNILDQYSRKNDYNMIHLIFRNEQIFERLKGEKAFLLFHRLAGMNIDPTKKGSDQIFINISKYGMGYLGQSILTVDGKTFYDFYNDTINYELNNSSSTYNYNGKENLDDWAKRVILERILEVYSEGSIVLRSD